MVFQNDSGLYSDDFDKIKATTLFISMIYVDKYVNKDMGFSTKMGDTQIHLLKQYWNISMLSTLIGKKKITEAAIARALTAGTIKAAERSFPEVLDHIRTCPYFEERPAISDGHDSPFILAIMTYNISRIPSYFDNGQDKRIAQEILHELADSTGSEYRQVSLMVKDCKDKIKGLNRPSKNLYYGLAKYLFHAYGLNEYQEVHFKDLNAPNPLFLKEMNLMLEPLVWNWEMILSEFKLTT